MFVDYCCNTEKVNITIKLLNFLKKDVVQFKTEKVNLTIKFSTFDLVKVLNFSSNKQLQFFGPNMPKNGSFGRKEAAVMTMTFSIFEIG